MIQIFQKHKIRKRVVFGREYTVEKPIDENTQKLAIKMKHDLSKSYSAINEANKLLEETRLLNEKQSKIINKFTIENIRLRKRLITTKK